MIRVLLVEDDEEDYIITRDLLNSIKSESYNLGWVKDYDTALETIACDRPDVCLIDYRLGDHNGIELLQEARSRGWRLPIILLTGIGDYRVDVEAMKCGAADYLTKGHIDSDILERCIRYAIERSYLLEALQRLAIVDDLTGLYNRREIDHLLKEEVVRCQRYQHSMSLVILDVDHFKRVNDTYGHQVGDEVLKWLGQVLRENLRVVDRPARYGGEEFALVLPDTDSSEAYRVSERLRKYIATHPFTLAPPEWELTRIPITVSLGVAGFPTNATSAESIIKAADLALYEAKRLGRNRTVQFTPKLAQTSLVFMNSEVGEVQSVAH